MCCIYPFTLSCFVSLRVTERKTKKIKNKSFTDFGVPQSCVLGNNLEGLYSLLCTLEGSSVPRLSNQTLNRNFTNMILLFHFVLSMLSQ